MRLGDWKTTPCGYLHKMNLHPCYTSSVERFTDEPFRCKWKEKASTIFLKKSFFMRASFVSYELTALQLSLPEKVSDASWISCSSQSLHDRLSSKLSWQPKRNPRTPVFPHNNLTSSNWPWVRATSYDDDLWWWLLWWKFFLTKTLQKWREIQRRLPSDVNLINL